MKRRHTTDEDVFDGPGIDPEALAELSDDQYDDAEREMMTISRIVKLNEPINKLMEVYFHV